MTNDEKKKFVLNTLSDKEKDLFHTSGETSSHLKKKEQEAVVYTKFIYDKDEGIPVGFVDLTDSGKLGLAKGDLNISFAVHSNYRNGGLAKALIKDAVLWFINSDYETLSFIMNKNNLPSKHLAESFGFVQMEYWKESNEYFYMITNPSKIKYINSRNIKMGLI